MEYFTRQQIEQLKLKGISLKKANSQLALFRKGIKAVQLLRPATVPDGIEFLSDNDVKTNIEIWEEGIKKNPSIKFVPASGAASRMFKSLFEVRNELKKHNNSVDEFLKKNTQINLFFSELRKYPFYDDLHQLCHKKDTNLDELLNRKKYSQILDLLLDTEGLRYGTLPKGMLKFHSYAEGSRTPMEEHLLEASAYLKDTQGKVRIHFTVSPEHRNIFHQEAERMIQVYSESGLADFEISFSEQDPSTDTLAVDMKNLPFLNSDGTLLFRPGGHGALLKNLEEINNAVVFIGNIDNIAPDRLKPLRVKYKKLLGGILLQRVDRIHTFLKEINTRTTVQHRTEITEFISQFISVETADKLRAFDDDKFLHISNNLLNRPVRVCGMVKNTGEPGGGPFWIKNTKGVTSKQIIESSQVDMENSQQQCLFNSSTHFNPVDLVCYMNDYKGNKFDLTKFVDQDMAFITVKSQGGRELKAMELPGLWNGAMAGWITFFVEVPAETFTPVKTVFDLIRPEHLS